MSRTIDQSLPCNNTGPVRAIQVAAVIRFGHRRRACTLGNNAMKRLSRWLILLCCIRTAATCPFERLMSAVTASGRPTSYVQSPRQAMLGRLLEGRACHKWRLVNLIPRGNKLGCGRALLSAVQGFLPYLLRLRLVVSNVRSPRQSRPLLHKAVTDLSPVSARAPAPVARPSLPPWRLTGNASLPGQSSDRGSQIVAAM